MCVSAFVSPVTQAWAKNEDPRERLLLLFGQLLMLLGTHVDEIAIVPPECNMTVQCDFVTAYSAHMYLLKLLQTYPGNKTNAVYQLMLDTAKRRLLALSSWAKVAEPGARFSARTSAQARLGVDLAQLLADGISICATDLIPLCAQILFDLVLSPTILQNVSDADFATVLCAAASLVQTARLPGLSGTWSDKGLVQLVHALGAAIDTLAYFVSASRVDGRNRLTLAEALSLCGEAAVGLIAGFLSDITPLTECDWATQAPAGALCDLACRLDIIAQVMALVCRHMAPADLVRRIQPQKVLQSLCRLHHWMAHALRKRDPDTEGEEGEVHTSREVRLSSTLLQDLQIPTPPHALT